MLWARMILRGQIKGRLLLSKVKKRHWRRSPSGSDAKPWKNWRLSLANCNSAHDSSGFPGWLPFLDAQSGGGSRVWSQAFQSNFGPIQE